MNKLMLLEPSKKLDYYSKMPIRFKKILKNNIIPLKLVLSVNQLKMIHKLDVQPISVLKELLNKKNTINKKIISKIILKS